MEATVRGCGSLLVAGFATLGLGCQTLPGPAPYPNPSRVAQGAILGSLAGAAVGAGVDHHDRGRGALVGAVGGLLAGAFLGGEFERHEYARHHAFHGDHDHGDAYEEDPEDAWCDGDHTWDDDRWDDHAWDHEPREQARPPQGVEPIAADVLFDPGSVTLSRGAKSRLRRLADAVREDPDAWLLLRGHTDEGEKDGFDLSEQRARAVRAYLAEEGVPGRRIAWVGFGAAQPVASSRTPAGRQRNRRVEIVQREPLAEYGDSRW